MIEFSEVPAILRRNIILLIVVPALFAVLALVFVTLKTPVYSTSAELLVEPNGVQILRTDPASASGNQALRNMDLQSQTYIILSAAVLNQVANALALDDSPRLRTPGLKTRLLAALLGDPRSSDDVRQETINALRETINVFRRDGSFVFSIQATHPDPELAAEIANATATAYIDQTRSSRAEALGRASTMLSKQAEELRARVEMAEAAVQSYKARQGLVSTATGSVVDQQLDGLNTQITNARVDLEKAKATYDQMAPLTLSDVEAGAVPQGSENSVLNSLRVTYAGIAQREAEAATTLGANHPSLRELRSQLSNTQRQIQGELQRIKQTVRGQYEQAQATLNALEQQSKGLQSQNAVEGKALIELRQLQSEADASRAVYESFLQRARELEELPELDTTASRILSEARVPTSASGPLAIVVITAAMIFGFCLVAAGAIGLAVLRGPLVSERTLVTGLDAPILASITGFNANGGSETTLRRGNRDAQRGMSQAEIAHTRVAYALRQSFADHRPANVLVLTSGPTGDTSRFVRAVAEELHSMGDEVLFAHTAIDTERSAHRDQPEQTGAKANLHALGQMAAQFSDSKRPVRDRLNGSEPMARSLASFLKVEQIDPSRKYASSGNLDSANEDFLLVDAGNIDASPMLPVLLRHCDGIILITAVGATKVSDFEHTIAYLEPWHDRVVGNVILKQA